MKPLICKLFTLFILNIVFHQQTVLSQNIKNSTSNEVSTLEWARSYPAVIKGVSSVNIEVKLNKQAVVYYAFYKNEVEDISAHAIKEDAVSASVSNVNVVKWGTIDYAGPTSVAERIEGLVKGKTYYLYMVAGNNDEFMDYSEIKSFKITFALKHKVVPLGNSTSPYGYLEFLPNGYNNTDSLFPLIVFLHGAGAIGDGSYTSLTVDAGLLHEGIIRFLESDLDLPAVVLSPQSLAGWVAKTIDDFIEFAKLNYRIDPDRIYITGYSMGGGGTWSYISGYPEKVAAAIPLSGINSSIVPQNLKDMPIWAFHNDKDPSIPLSSTIDKVNSIVKAGGNPFLSVFESDEHNSTFDAYHYPGVWEWLFAQRKSSGIREAGVVNVYRTYLTQNIDGDLTDSSWMVQTNRLNTPKSSCFDSSTFRLLWDADNLYIGVDMFISDKAEINADDYEVAVYLNGNNNSDSSYDSFDKAIYYTNSSVEGTGSIDAIEYSWLKKSNNISLETAIPFKDNFCLNPFAGNGFGFDIAVSNKLNNEKFYWNGNVENTVKTNYFGNVLLSLKTPENEKQTNIFSSELEVDNSFLTCFPNPFSNITTISYKNLRTSNIIIKLMDFTGKEIAVLKDGFCDYTSCTFIYDGGSLKPGIYMICMYAGGIIYRQKLIKR